MHLEEIWGESVRSVNLTRYKWQNDSAWNWQHESIWKHNIYLYLFFGHHYRANYYLDGSKPLIKMLLTWEARVVSGQISLNEHKLIAAWLGRCLIMFEPKITTPSNVPRNMSRAKMCRNQSGSLAFEIGKVHGKWLRGEIRRLLL